MSVLKKLVCKRVQSDSDERSSHDGSLSDDVASSTSGNPIKPMHTTSRRSVLPFSPFRRHFSSSPIVAENVPRSVQHQLEELDSYARLNDNHHRSVVNGDESDEAKEGSTTVDGVDDDFMVREIRKSLRPLKHGNGTKGSDQRSFVDEQGLLEWVESSRNNSGASTRMPSKLRPVTLATDRLRRNPNGKDENFCSVDEIKRRAAIKEALCPDLGLVRFDTNTDRRDDHSTLHQRKGSINPQPLLRNQSQSTRSRKKKTRFADVLEQRYFLAPVHEHEATPGHFVACMPNDCYRKSILKISTPVNRRYYMPTDQETKITDEDETSRNWNVEDVSVVSDDQSFFSSEYSMGDLSETSVGSMEILLNHLFCSPTDNLTSSDWMR